VADLTVEYVNDGYSIKPFDGLGFEAGEGELVVLLGPSGSGKTTLLSCLGGMMRPTSGSIQLGDESVTGMTPAELGSYRRRRVGFVFQAFNLIPSLSARENVAVPLLVTGTKKRDALARADEMLVRVGLGDRLHHRPSKLSGGQQQRVAVARGLVHGPQLLLADEPTANLDHVQAEGVISLLRGMRDEGRTIVVSTHDARLVPVADRVVQMAAESGESHAPPVSVEYVEGEVIFDQGDQADLVFVVESGRVEIYHSLVDGGEESIRFIEDGGYFGELGSLLGFPRSASARAAGNTRLTAYSPSDFRSIVLDEM
jgi:putative ABC transport system ATP-binding protein